MKDSDDQDWGYGSNDVREAIRMAEDLESDEAYIAIIDTDGEALCVGTIRRDEEGDWVSEEQE